MKKSVPVLIPFLILVSMLFIGILIYAYVETKKANPKMIEVGQTIGFRRLSTRSAMTDHEGDVAVGVRVASHPPHGSVGAELPHTALTSDDWRRSAAPGKDAPPWDEAASV
jgi:hypothetical protein